MESHGLHDVLQADGALDLPGALPRGLLNHINLDAAVNLGLNLKELGLDVSESSFEMVFAIVTAAGKVLSMELNPDSDLERPIWGQEIVGGAAREWNLPTEPLSPGRPQLLPVQPGVPNPEGASCTDHPEIVIGQEDAEVLLGLLVNFLYTNRKLRPIEEEHLAGDHNAGLDVDHGQIEVFNFDHVVDH